MFRHNAGRELALLEEGSKARPRRSTCDLLNSSPPFAEIGSRPPPTSGRRSRTRCCCSSAASGFLILTSGWAGHSPASALIALALRRWERRAATERYEPGQRAPSQPAIWRHWGAHGEGADGNHHARGGSRDLQAEHKGERDALLIEKARTADRLENEVVAAHGELSAVDAGRRGKRAVNWRTPNRFKVAVPGVCQP